MGAAIPGLSAGRRERALQAFALAAAGLALALLAKRALIDPEGVLVLRDQPAQWIMASGPTTAVVQQWGLPEPVRTTYGVAFVLDEVPTEVRLTARALGSFRVFVNGESAPLPPRPSWRETVEVDAAGLLRPGRNELRAEVTNARGPGLLSLRLAGDGVSVETGRGWSARTGDAPPVRAVPADDLRALPDATRGEIASEALASLWLPLVLLFALGSGGFALAVRAAVPPPILVPALALVCVGWLVLFATSFAAIELETGFDARHHLVYLESVREGSLPLATDGWSTYHPPLFYWLSAAAIWLSERLGAVGFAASAKLVPFLAGLGNALLPALLVRRLLPGRDGLAAASVLFAGTLPMNLVLAAYFSNEGLQGLFAGAGLVAAALVILDGRVGPLRIALCSALLGLALLTKFTALVVAVVALVALAVQIWMVHGAASRAAWLRFAALWIPVLAIAGWFYARNVVEFGRPIVGNWDLPGEGRDWWSHPGFHTPAYYLGFGQSLVRPFYAGFHSFLDSLYSTLWGDGYLGGRATLGSRHPHWSYVPMAAGYLLALPATLLMLAGWVRAGFLAVADPRPERRGALALLVVAAGALGFSVLWLTLSLAFFGQAKSFYALSAMPALVVFFALGYGAVDDWLARRGATPARAALCGWLVATAGIFYAGFAGLG